MVLRVLFDARRQIKRKGWIKFYSSTPDGICLSHAVHTACKKYHVSYRSVAAEIAELLPKDNNVYGSLIAFNDSYETTKSDIIRLLNRAILRELRMKIRLPFTS